ncbi:MAG: hypothetical protein KDA29_13445 [Phycisphaerales bacterium]|nr:hypothetical protein [Phycisphaerales bacterium]
MSTLDASNTRLTPDDRFELASRAQGQQRLNAPRHLIVMGVLLLIISLIALGVAWQTNAAASKKNERAARDLVKIEGLITEINALKAARATNPDDDKLKPLPDILSTLQNLATRAGLQDVGLPRNQSSRPEGDAILKTYPYTNINDASLENLLEWVRLAEQDIPGMQVRELTLQPRPQSWSLSVVFARYERRP